MAMFGFVYAWYLMVVLLLEIWFDYRESFVLWSRTSTGWRKWMYRILTLGATDLSERSLKFDRQAGKWITLIGIPSAFLLHGYVGFIFGSIKANPWWSSVLMPVVFLFSAIVSGIALVLFIYIWAQTVRGKAVDMLCTDKLASFLFYSMIVDFSLEMLDFVHRLYEAEESIAILGQLVESRLFISLIVLQVLMGTVIPLIILVLVSPALKRGGFLRSTPELRRMLYLGVAVLVQIGIFSIRWNVVIGGQLFSKSLRGLTTYKVELFGVEGLAMTLFLLILPLAILWAFVKIMPPWVDGEAQPAPAEA
jgi:Ni/Fe-hydrogenase subunit HybB-like protein